jgi:hypothetical protein
MYSFIATAREFQSAARLVAARERKQKRTRWRPVGKYLACLSIEMALKAFLMLKGRSRKKVESYGHDLDKLLRISTGKNLAEFANLTTSEIAEIEKAAKYYTPEGSVFRYPPVYEIARGYPGDPNITPLLKAAKKLVDGLYYPIRAAA